MTEITRRQPRPKPPVEIVYNDDGTIADRVELKNSDEYRQALNEWNLDVEDKYKRLVIKRGVAPRDLAPHHMAEVQELRAFMQDEFNMPMDKDDLFVWVAFILCEDLVAYQELSEAIVSRSQPTESAIGDALENFSGNIPQG